MSKIDEAKQLSSHAPTVRHKARFQVGCMHPVHFPRFPYILSHVGPDGMFHFVALIDAPSAEHVHEHLYECFPAAVLTSVEAGVSWFAPADGMFGMKVLGTIPASPKRNWFMRLFLGDR